MKLLVFAHIPPPHHGQSYMVKLMLEGFGGDQRRRFRAHSGTAGQFGVLCYHVNARLSRNLGDIGEFRPEKVLLMLWYCFEAIWCRFRYGVTTMYYVPTPGKSSALVRDWMVMQICRPFFKKVVLHWHAAGLAKWLETSTLQPTRRLTYHLLKAVDLSMVLSKYNRADAEKLLPQHIRVVSNGIPDPCPDFATQVLPRRLARIAARKKLMAGCELTLEDMMNTGGDPRLCRVLFLAHCTRDKGVLDAIEAVKLAARKLAVQRSPLRLQLVVAGGFVTTDDEKQFKHAMADPENRENIVYLGFVAGQTKHDALIQADVFCFPTFYRNENQPVNLIEALAYGLPVVTTRWRSVPEILPPHYAGLVETHKPQQLAEAILNVLDSGSAKTMRAHFEAGFTIEKHLSSLAAALHSVE